MASRTDLIVRVLDLLGVSQVGQDPSAEDREKVDSFITPTVKMLANERVAIVDPDNVSDGVFEQFAIVVASAAAPAFGQPRDNETIAREKDALRVAQASEGGAFSRRRREFAGDAQRQLQVGHGFVGDAQRAMTLGVGFVGDAQRSVSPVAGFVGDAQRSVSPAAGFVGDAQRPVSPAVGFVGDRDRPLAPGAGFAGDTKTPVSTAPSFAGETSRQLGSSSSFVAETPRQLAPSSSFVGDKPRHQ